MPHETTLPAATVGGVARTRTCTLPPSSRRPASCSGRRRSRRRGPGDARCCGGCASTASRSASAPGEREATARGPPGISRSRAGRCSRSPGPSPPDADRRTRACPGPDPGTTGSTPSPLLVPPWRAVASRWPRTAPAPPVPCGSRARRAPRPRGRAGRRVLQLHYTVTAAPDEVREPSRHPTRTQLVRPRAGPRRDLVGWREPSRGRSRRSEGPGAPHPRSRRRGRGARRRTRAARGRARAHAPRSRRHSHPRAPGPSSWPPATTPRGSGPRGSGPRGSGPERGELRRALRREPHPGLVRQDDPPLPEAPPRP